MEGEGGVVGTYVAATTTSSVVTGWVRERSWMRLSRLSMAAFRDWGLGAPPSVLLSNSCRRPCMETKVTCHNFNAKLRLSVLREPNRYKSIPTQFQYRLKKHVQLTRASGDAQVPHQKSGRNGCCKVCFCKS